MNYVNADTLANGLSAFAPETFAIKAGRIMLKQLREMAEKRTDFAFESTLASRSYANWIRKLCEQGYEFHLFFLWLRRPEVAVQRVKERVRMGGHNIPEEVIRRRYEKGSKNFFVMKCLHLLPGLLKPPVHSTCFHLMLPMLSCVAYLP